MLIKSFALVFVYITLTAAGHLLLKFGAVQQSPATERALFGLIINPYTFLGLVFWIGATFLWIRVLQRHPLYLVYSLTSVNYVLVPLFSSLILKESVTSLNWMGIVMIALGVALILYGQAHSLNIKP